MEKEVNTTYLYLIPKCYNNVTLKNFRPSGLCNTQYKIITKIIANKIKPFLSKIIGPTEANFLPDRIASDNAIIV